MNYAIVIQIIIISIALYIATSIFITNKINNKITTNKNELISSSNIEIIYAIIFGIAGYTLSKFIPTLTTGSRILLTIAFVMIGKETPKEVSNKKKEKIKEQLLQVSFIFEIGYKANIPLDKILVTVSRYFTENEKLQKIFQKASAIYKKTRDTEEAFNEIENEININEIRLLKNAIIEAENTGNEGIKALEMYVKMQSMREIELLTKKANSVSTKVTITVSLILFAIILIYFIPLFNIIIDSLTKNLG